MVIVAGMVREILSTSGPINNLITKLGGEAITFISLPEWFTTIFVTTGVWQASAWGTILYLAAMSGINTELYELHELDGANRFQAVPARYHPRHPAHHLHPVGSEHRQPVRFRRFREGLPAVHPHHL